MISGSEHSPKKLIIEFNFITKLPSETSVYCLKSPPTTFQNVLFKHGFFSNNFQTTLFWTPWPNIFFQILDTSVQCLNTEHCVLKRHTKRPLSLSLSLHLNLSLWVIFMPLPYFSVFGLMPLSGVGVFFFFENTWCWCWCNCVRCWNWWDY